MAGYSTTPLVRKLGIKPGMRVRIGGAPEHFLDLVGPLPEGARLLGSTRGSVDYAHLFASSRSTLRRRLPALERALTDDGLLWISWPKQASSLATDLKEGMIREDGLAAGLVDVKICAIDEDWSGLKFVYRVADRGRSRR